jgi:hypothetical protein
MTTRNSNNSIDIVANNIKATETLVIPSYDNLALFPNVQTLDQGTILFSKTAEKLYYVAGTGSPEVNAYFELSTSALPPGSFWTQLGGGSLQNTNVNGNVVIANNLSANVLSGNSVSSLTGNITTMNSTTVNSSIVHSNDIYATGIYCLNIDASSGFFNSITSNSMSLSGDNSKLLFNNDIGKYIGLDTGNNAIVISNHGNNNSVELETRHVSIGQGNTYDPDVCVNISGKKNNFNNIQVRLQHDDVNSGLGYLMTPDNNFNIACNDQSKMNLGYLTGGDNGIFVSQLDFSPNLNTVNVNGNLTLNGQGLAPPLWFEGPPSTIYNTVNKVLIGTNSSSQTEKLIVQDSQIITSGGNAILRQKAYNSVYPTEIVDYGGEWNVRSADPNKFISFSPSGTERLRISTTGVVNVSGLLTVNGNPINDDWALSGNNLYNNNLTGQVSIGTTSPSLFSKFQVQDDNTNVTPCQFIISGNTNGNNQLLIGYDTTQEYGSVQAFKQGVGNRPLCLQPLNGGVGIGLTAPSYGLDVIGNINSRSGELFLKRDLTDNVNRRNWKLATEAHLVGDMNISVSTTNTGAPSTNVMEFTKEGNIGIGKLPSYRLDVQSPDNILSSFRKDSNSGDAYIEAGQATTNNAIYLGWEGGEVAIGKRNVARILGYNGTSTNLYAGNVNVSNSLSVNTNTPSQQINLNKTVNWNGSTPFNTISSSDGVLLLHGVHIPQNGNNGIRFASNNTATEYGELNTDTNGFFTKWQNVERSRITTGGNFILNNGVAQGGCFFGSTSHGIQRDTGTNIVRMKTTGGDAIVETNAVIRLNGGLVVSDVPNYASIGGGRTVVTGLKITDNVVFDGNNNAIPQLYGTVRFDVNGTYNILNPSVNSIIRSGVGFWKIFWAFNLPGFWEQYFQACVSTIAGACNAQVYEVNVGETWIFTNSGTSAFDPDVVFVQRWMAPTVPTSWRTSLPL